MSAMDIEESPAPAGNSGQEFSTDLLRVYYDRMFPYQEMFDWLSYGNDVSRATPGMELDFFSRREWSFTIEDDIYIRYQSFRDKSEMVAAIIKRQPHKIDIGAVFSGMPKDHATLAPEKFKPVERELVFDIDMTDYDDIRTCCTGANICLRCWPYMTMALKVVDQILRDDFGFKHMLWVYSGRRGIHCWVADKEARGLSNEARSAVVEYMIVELGNGDDKKSLKSPFAKPMHPLVRRAYETMEPFFEEYIVGSSGQSLLSSRANYTKALADMPDVQIRSELLTEWERAEGMSGEERWRQLKARTTAPITPAAREEQQKKRSKTNFVELEQWRYRLVFTHCYPRLDRHVSTAQNHLLKSPFCVHPKTGRVCIPIDPAGAEKFNPFAVPTVRTLCDEVDAYDRDHAGTSADTRDIDKTSMADSMRVFDRTFMRGLWSTIRKEQRAKAEEIAAYSADF